jgi:hydrogenase 3 maturation protease
MKGDDGVGPYVAARLIEECSGSGNRCTGNVVAIDCGTTPENFTSVIRRLHPELLVIVDAAEMGLGAGECRIIPPDRAGALGLSTHSMPLSLFVSYVADLARTVVIVGVQPHAMAFAEGLSPEVKTAAERLVSDLATGQMDDLLVLD